MASVAWKSSWSRSSLISKSTRRGQKSPICEELHSENFMLKFLTWENAWGEFAYPLIRLRMAHISEISVHDFANSGKKLARAAPILMWGRGGSGRAARHRAYTWGMANNDQGYDPFEPGHSTPEFEQFARENQKYRKASHARGGAGGQKRMPSSGARSRSADAGGAGPRVAGSRNANSRVASSRSGSPRAAASAGRGGSPSSGSAGRHASRGAGKTLPQTRAADSRKTAGRTAAPMQKAPSRSSRPVSSQPPLQAPEPQPVLARAHSKAHNVVGVLVCVLLAIAL